MRVVLSAWIFILSLAVPASPTIPWGWAEGPSGRTELTDAAIPSDATNVTFAAGDVVLDGIALSDRKLSFTADPAGTTIVVGGARSGFDLSGASGDWTFRGITFRGTGERSDLVYDGGAIACRGGRLTLVGCSFERLSSRFTGGAVSACLMDGDVTVSNCTFTGNASGPMNGMGGALYCSRGFSGTGTLRVDGCTFRGNSAQNGGAVSTVRVIDDFESPMPTEVTGCAFRGNTADYSGGAIDDEGDLSVTNTLFADNSAALQGGAICAGTSDPGWVGADLMVFAGTEFRGNSAENSIADSRYWTCGGAIAVAGAGFSLSVSGRHVVFDGTRAESASSSYGGAIFADEETSVGVACAAFLANQADKAGGAVFSWGDSLGLSTSIFSNNTVTAANGFGGAVSVEEASLDMRNCTVRGSNGGAVDAYRSKATLANCVVVDNGAMDISVGGGAGAELVAEYTSYGRTEVAEETPVTTNACLSGRDKSIYLGESLYLDSLGIYLLEAYEGIEQDARDYDGVKYDLPPAGGSMGAYETPTGRLLATVSGSRRYDGTTDGPKTLVWTLVNMYGRPVTLPGLADLADLFDVTGWSFGSSDADFYSSAGDVPEKRVFIDYSVKPGAYALRADMISVVAEGSILKRPLKFRSADAEKPYDTLPLVRQEVCDVSGEAFDAPCGLVAGETVSFDVTGSQTDVGSSPNRFTVQWTGTALSSNYELVPEYGTLTVTAHDASGLWVAYPDPFYYGGTNICPAVTVALTNGLGQVVSNLVEGVDFEVACADNVNAFDSPYLVVTPSTNFTGTVTNGFRILPRPVVFRSADATKVYDGTPLTTNEVTYTRQSGDVGILTNEEAYLSFDVTGSQTEVGSSSNGYEVVWGEGIDPRNYEATYEYGTLTVLQRPLPAFEIASVEWYHNRGDGLYYPRIVIRFTGGDATRLAGATLTCDGTAHALPEACVAELRTATTPGQTFAFGVDPDKFPVSYSRTAHDGYIIWNGDEEKERAMLFSSYQAARPLTLELGVVMTPECAAATPAEIPARLAPAVPAPFDPYVHVPVGEKVSLALEELMDAELVASLADGKSTVKAVGLPSGLKLVKTAVKEKVGKATKTVGYRYSVEGKAKEALDGVTRVAYVRITKGGGSSLHALNLCADPAEGTAAPGPDFVLDLGSAPVADRKARVMQGVALSLPIENTLGSTVTASGLPSGLKLVKTAVKEKVGKVTKTVGYAYAVSGVPTKAGDFVATFRTAQDKKTRVTTTAFAVEPLPLWAYGTFAGWSAAGSTNLTGFGAASLSVTAAGKASGKVAVEKKTWSFSASGYSGYDATAGVFAVTAVAKSGTAKRNVRLEISPDVFCRCSFADVAGESDWMTAELRRKVWSDRPATWKLGNATFAPDACPDVKASVAASGTVRFSGKLPDGTKVSSSTTAFVAEDGSFHAWLIVPATKKSAGRMADVLLEGSQR